MSGQGPIETPARSISWAYEETVLKALLGAAVDRRRFGYVGTTNRELRFCKVKRKSASKINGEDGHSRLTNGELGRADTEMSPQVNSKALLFELQHAHETLISAMDELDLLTRGQVPTVSRLSSTRWKLSKASLSRRMLWGKILIYLSPGMSMGGTNALRQLQERDINLLRASTQHVSKWTTEAALTNWSGYCDASRSIRRKMAAGIDAEKRILYPMLGAEDCPQVITHDNVMVGEAV